MTADLSQRTAGTEQYLKRRRPELLKWFGERARKKYCSSYYVNVVGGLGFSSALRRDTWGAKRLLWKSFSRESTTFLSNLDLTVVLFGGKYLYNLLRTLMTILRNKHT